MKISLLVAVYRNHEFLARVLASIFVQRRMPDEVIICQDGDDPSISAELSGWNFPCKLIHLQQKDQGNRKPLIMNKGFAKASGDYIITIDGDCVLDPGFVEAHQELASEKLFLTGRRVELSEQASKTLSKERILSGYLNRPLSLWWDALLGRSHHLGRFFQTPKILRGILRQNEVHDIRGCNFSVHKKHLLAINGYRNDFSGAYGEDSDLEFRLKNIGLSMASVKGAALQYHLWHPEQVHDQDNQKRLEEWKKNPNARASSGLLEAQSIE